jgi:hypothetical protein
MAAVTVINLFTTRSLSALGVWYLSSEGTKVDCKKYEGEGVNDGYRSGRTIRFCGLGDFNSKVSWLWWATRRA